MVQRDQQLGLVVGHANQRVPQQRSLLEIERHLGFTSLDAGRPLAAFGVGKRSQVEHRQRRGAVRRNSEERLPLAADERRPQRFVTLGQNIEALLERGDVYTALESKRGHDVIGGALRTHLVQEPEALLAERQRQVAVACDGFERDDRPPLRLARAQRREDLSLPFGQLAAQLRRERPFRRAQPQRIALGPKPDVLAAHVRQKLDRRHISTSSMSPPSPPTSTSSPCAAISTS